MPIDRSKWYNMWGNLIAGIKPYKNPNTWPRTQIVDDWDGTIQSLNCGSFINYGTLEVLKPANNVSSSVSYAGGNGGSYPAQTVNSTGVTGLNAKLQSGFFLLSGGTLTYTISGTPSTSGTASFAIQVGGKSCTLKRVVEEVEPLNAIILNASLISGETINGYVGGSDGYYKVKYWDGTSEVVQSWTWFSKICTSSGNGSIGSYGTKQIKIWGCDVNGNPAGNIVHLELNNSKYVAFELNNMEHIRYLTIENNTQIQTSNLDFTKLSSIEQIRLANLPSVTGELTLTNVTSFDQPIFINQGGYLTDEAGWDGIDMVTKSIDIQNLPITSLNISGLDGLTYLILLNTNNLTTINSTGCTHMDTIDIRNANSLSTANFNLPKLKTLLVQNTPNYTTEIVPQIGIKRILLKNLGIPTIDLSNLTSLNELELSNMTQIDSVGVTSLHNNYLLTNTLEIIRLIDVACPYIDLVSFNELTTAELKKLPNVTSLLLPTSTKNVFLHNMQGITPAKMDEFLIALDSSGVTNGFLQVQPYTSTDLRRTTASTAAVSSLLSKFSYVSPELMTLTTT